MRRFAVAALAVALLPSKAAAQRATGISLTPYLGIHIPARTLLLRPGATPNLSEEKVSVTPTIGARLTFGLSPVVGLEGDLGYSSGNLVLSRVGTASGTDVKILTASGRLIVRLKPPTEPFYLTLTGGVGAVRHEFDDAQQGPGSDVDPRTSIGGVVGVHGGFRLGRVVGLSLGLESYLYSARFDVANLTGPGKTATDSRMQNDIRVLIGLRFPFLGM